MMRVLLSTLVVLAGIAMGDHAMAASANEQSDLSTHIVKLPEPKKDSDTSVEETLLKRRSCRNYKNVPIPLSDLSQILWAAQGITSKRGLRTAPSAGALYPLEIYIAAGNIPSLSNGIYKYLPPEHELQRLHQGDKRSELAQAALGQTWMADSAAIIAIFVAYDKIPGMYGNRGIQYAHMEAGNVSQNIHLQAVSLGLGTVVVGAMDDEMVTKIIRPSEKSTPLCLMPV